LKTTNSLIMNIRGNNNYHRKLDSSANFQLNFLPVSKQVYGFDYLGSGNHGIFSNSEYYPKSENGYDFRYKSIETGKTDYVKVDFSNYNGIKDSVIFKDRYGIKLKLSKDNILTFTGTQKPDTNYIYAYDKNGVRIGKLMLKTYTPKTYNIVLVSVNGEKLPNVNDLKKYLNEIYKQSVTNFEISTTTLEINDLFPFKHGDKKRLSGYNDDQKRVLQAFDSQAKDDINYLFFMPDGVETNGVAGYNPFGYNFGFIYHGAGERTIAHELGHGIGSLKHPFDDQNRENGNTANLMDYNDKTELYHFQWNAIQNPPKRIFKWNFEEEGAELIEFDNLVLFWSEKDLLKQYFPNTPNITSGMFLAPSGKPIWLDWSNEKNISFAVCIDNENGVGLGGDLNTYAIYGYDKGEKIKATVSQYQFEGFLNKNSQENISFNDTKNHLSDIIWVWNKSEKHFEPKTTQELIADKNFVQYEDYDSEGDYYAIDNSLIYIEEENDIQNGYFTIDMHNSYLENIRKNTKQTIVSLSNDEKIINQFVQRINKENSLFNTKIEEVLYKLEEKYCKKFNKETEKENIKIKFLEIKSLTFNQRQWNELTEKVFKQAQLDEYTTLTTIPYVDISKYIEEESNFIFMPGIYQGEKVLFNDESLTPYLLKCESLNSLSSLDNSLTKFLDDFIYRIITFNVDFDKMTVQELEQKVKFIPNNYSNKPKIKIWIDKTSPNVNVDFLNKLENYILKEFYCTCFYKGYNLEFTDSIICYDDDISVWITSSDKWKEKTGRSLTNEWGTSLANNEPIWVTPYCDKQIFYTAFSVIHELGHRITSFATVLDINRFYHKYNNDSHDMQRNTLMSEGNLIDASWSDDSKINFENLCDIPLFKIGSHERAKLIYWYFIYLYKKRNE
ncbi:MAG: zinc-dependent metalloprotease, partial [Bacteroidales bacterium]|nr:zinc-dependent metalloprotease [Bacteroidales bacterium]